MVGNPARFATLSNYIRMRLELEPDFAQRVKANPQSELRALGVNDNDFADHAALAAADCNTRCYDTTCWSSACPGTCTTPSIPTPTR